MKHKREKSIYIDGLENYIHTHLIQRPFPELPEAENYAKENFIPTLPPSTGEVLSFLVKTYSPKNILELGTGLGCSILWMLSGLENPVKITTIDRDIKAIEKAKTYIDEVLKKTNIEKHTVIYNHSPIMEFLYSYKEMESHDFLFVDCDKIHYAEIFLLFKEKLARGSYMVFDNTLWHGRIADPAYRSPSDISVRKLWELVKASGLKHTLFTNGDGLLLIEI
jgi:caffeoyl-CoA O-methyltransferase